jgi:hypothetical protein
MNLTASKRKGEATMDSRPSPTTDLKNDQFPSKRRSLGRRAFRSLARFLIAVFIGVVGTLAWQSYGEATKQTIAICLQGWSRQTCVDTAKQMIASWPGQLGWTPPEIAAEPPRAVPAFGQNAQQAAPVAQFAAMAGDLAALRQRAEQFAVGQEQLAALRQRVEQLAAGQEQLAALRQRVEQLAAGQEQLAALRQRVEQFAAGQEQLAAGQEQLTRDIAKLQTAEQDIHQENRVPPPQGPARKPVPMPPAPSRAPILPR